MDRPDQETTRGHVRRAGTGLPEAPYLLGIAGEHAGRIFPLDGLREVFIGRDHDCEIVFSEENRSVSRRHVVLTLDESRRAWINDLNSLNGTLVNGVMVTRPQQLRRGDRIFIGEWSIFKIDWLTDDEVVRWQLASVDALTGCMNRASFQSRLEDLVQNGVGLEMPISLLLADVDRFKAINDSHGHQVGDFVLERMGSILKDTLAAAPGQPPAYRYGGEEFAVLLPDSPPPVAVALAETIRVQVEKRDFAYKDLRLSVTISIGVATHLPGPPLDTMDLIRMADERLYRAKHEGRNRVIA